MKNIGSAAAGELQTAKALGIKFSDDGKFLLASPPDIRGAVIPSCVTGIGNKAFFGCENLNSVTLPDSVAEIGDAAFYDCANLDRLTLPAGVTKIGESAFSGVKSIEAAPDNRKFYVDDSGVLIDRRNKKILYSPRSISGHYTIPDGIKKIGDRTFAMCEKLCSVTFPDSMTQIGEYAFLLCENLNSVTLPAGMTGIREGAFLGCENLCRITLPDSISKIGYMAFLGCKNLRRITLFAGTRSRVSEWDVLFPENCQIIRRK